VAAAVTAASGPEGGPSGRVHPGLRVLDEAVRLLDVLQAEQPRRSAASGPDTDGDAPHPGPECRVCPVCRGLAALRAANPQAVARMTRAVADLAAAIGEFVAGPERGEPAAPAPEAGTGKRWYATCVRAARSPATVQRIDVTD
jgi:hypothetical protein